MAKKKSFNKQT